MYASPLSFAHEELARYARRMDASWNADRICFVPFSAEDDLRHHVRDAFWDDAYEILIENGAGQIRYSNERSALLAVYHLLRKAGCAFLRPGPMGEIIPKKSLGDLTVSDSVTAAHRHRGICIEGSNRIENVVDMIDFAPKAGYNTYFTQFMDCYTFFERWYTHMDNPLLPGGIFTEDMAKAMLDVCVKEIKRRGLLYHAVGHGWTCEPFGIPGKHWADDGEEATPEQVPHLALVNGKRALRGGIGLNTNLCYSRPDTRKIMADYIADYALAHPEIDVLHVWLADENNNHCECEECRKMIPSDFYVVLLNEIDQRLQEVGSPVRIAFLLYYELLLPPIQQKLINEDRFILMYAPITRRFSQSYLEVTPRYTHTPYVRNRMHFSSDVSENLGFLQQWKTSFKGDGFDFDYHLCGVSLCEPGGLLVSRVLHDDILSLHKLGLDGMINCQFMRAAMPHAFGTYIGGLTQLNPALDYEQELEHYFSQYYGREYPHALSFLRTLSDLIPLDNLRNFIPTEEAAERLTKLRDFCADCELPQVHTDQPALQRSWDMLRYWKKFWQYAAEYLRCQMNQDVSLRKQAFSALEQFAWETEPLFQGELDTYYFLHYFRMRFGD